YTHPYCYEKTSYFSFLIIQVNTLIDLLLLPLFLTNNEMATQALIRRTSRAAFVSRHIQTSARRDAAAPMDSAKKGAEGAKKVGEDMKGKAEYAAGDMSQKGKEMAGEAANMAQNVTEKAKQTVQGAWGTMKDTTQKIKDSVMHKAGESKDCVKENAEAVKSSMNSKKSDLS
ncbi:Uncharacterized protein At4g13230, partial [Linum grandiflorum]